MNFAPENSPQFISRMAASTGDDASAHWVGGDGGPLVVLQATAAVQWQGALGSEDNDEVTEDVVKIDAQDVHLYLPTELAFETDSDAAFLCGNYITRRYDRDMLVLEDSEWTGRLFVLSSGAVGVVQVQHIVDDLPTAIRQALDGEPEQSGMFDMQDDSLRLIVGADTGTNSTYRFVDIPFAPGVKLWKRYEFEFGWIYTLE